MLKIVKILPCILLVFISVNLKSQQWLWSRHFKTSQPSIVTGLDLDASNNVYVTGQFKASMSIGWSSNISPFRANNTDFYLVKYNTNNVHQWHVQLANNLVAAKINSKNVVVDPSGNPVVCGFYDQSITVGVGTTLPVYKAGRPNSFVAKYNASNGIEIWTKRVAWGPDSVKAQWVTTDPDGNIYFTGFSKDSVFFTGDTLLTSGSRVQNFIAKYDGDGNFLWATQIKSSATNSSLNKFVEIHAASSDEIYLGGFFTDTLRTGGITLKSVSAGVEDAVLIKIDGSGVVQWARQVGSAGPDRCDGIATDIYSNVYITGYISGSALFDSTGNGSLNSSPLVSKNNSSDMMVAKYNKNGTLFWKKCNGDIGTDVGYGAYIHENIIQFAGSFAGSVTFNNTTISTPAVTNQDPGFFVYDINGNPITAQKAQGTTGNDNNDRTELIVYDNGGNTYLGGYFTSTKLTIGDSVYTNGTSNNNNAFICKYHNPFSVTFSTATNVSCNGGNNGKLIATPYFGVAPYAYQWSGNVADHTDSAAFNLIAGNYSVTVTDSRDSITSASITVTQGSSFFITSNKTDLSCFQSKDGAIDLTVSGGTPAYSYNWTGVSGYNPITQDQTGLAAGLYKYTITDKLGCQMNDSITLLEPGKIIFGTTVVTPAIPAGSSNGKIDINITGGTPAFSYAWLKNGVSMPGRTSDTLNNLNGAIYTVNVLDDNSCSADTNFVVADANLLQIDKHITNVSCNGLSDGSAYVSIINKNPLASYSYNWSNSSVDSIISNVPAGKYSLTITETGGLGRNLSDTIIVNEPGVLTISSIVPQNVICSGESTGAITLSVTGGTQLYSYLWSSGQTVESLSQIPAGHYIVTVNDAHNCQVIDSTDVTASSSMDITYALVQALRCYGFGNGIVRADVTGGLPPYNYLWDDPGTQTSSSANGLYAGTYHTIVTDANNCKDTGTYNLIQPDQIAVSAVDTNNVSCYYYSDGSIKVSVQGGQAPYSYSWSPDVGSTDSIGSLGPGIQYKLTVTDNNFCQNTAFSYVIKKPSAPLTLVEKLASHVDNPCYEDSVGIAELSSSGGWGNNEYTLDGSNWYASPVFSSLKATTYVATVRDHGGCYQNDVNIIIKEATKISASPYINGNSIFVFAVGGTGTLHYSLDGGTAQISGQFNNVEAGTHSITVTDDNNCEVVLNGIIVITGIEVTKITLCTISPNPSDGVFNLQFTSQEDNKYSLEVFNVVGVRVYENNILAQQNEKTNYSIDLSKKASGIYIIKFNGIPLNERLIKK